MGFGAAIGTCFRKFVTFRGRARRAEYWWFALFSTLVSIPATFLDAFVAPTRREGPFSTLVTLVLFLPQLSVIVRRLHDTNRSGWLLLAFYGYVIAALAAGLWAGVVTLDGPRQMLTNFELLFLVVLATSAGAFFIWMLVLTILKGTAGPNAYGEDPLGPSVDVFN
jgi:uncharacterized membrane protein YhaH (DUF805 family)